MALREYLAEEVAEDWVDGHITRREAMRRLSLLGLSVGAAGSLLAACAAAATPSPAAPSRAATAAPTAPASAASSAPSVAPSAAASAAGSAPASPAGSAGAGEAITFPGPRGELLGFFAPAATPKGGMLVIHENRGLTDHIRSVAARLASDGYSALAIDLLSEEGGTDAVTASGSVQSALAGASDERLVTDMQAGIDELARRLPGLKLGAIGFCFGGGMVWALLDEGEPRLAAAIPFYGPAPDQPDFGGSSAAVLGVYAEMDSRVNASRDSAEAALTAAGLTHEIKTYPGVDHAFFNDTGQRYNAKQAAAVYADVLAWLVEHLAG